jgi:hypothetical protein
MTIFRGVGFDMIDTACRSPGPAYGGDTVFFSAAIRLMRKCDFSASGIPDKCLKTTSKLSICFFWYGVTNRLHVKVVTHNKSNRHELQAGRAVASGDYRRIPTLGGIAACVGKGTQLYRTALEYNLF